MNNSYSDHLDILKYLITCEKSHFFYQAWNYKEYYISLLYIETWIDMLYDPV